MTIKQLSVFIENRSGTLLRVFSLFKEARIQLIACTTADTLDYGICRIICDDPQRALQVLKDAGVSVAISDVFALQLDNKPGRAADAIEVLSQNGIGITYLYSFMMDDKGVLIFRTDNPEKTEKLLH